MINLIHSIITALTGIRKPYLCERSVPRLPICVNGIVGYKGCRYCEYFYN